MLEEANDARNVRFRKDRNVLNIAGTGVMLFGIWSVIKTYTTFFEAPAKMFEGIDELSEMDMTEIILLSCTLAMVLSFDLLIRLYVGLKSRAESKGKKAGSLYLLVTIFLSIASLGFFILEVFSFVGQPELSTIAEMIVELTSLIIQIELLISAIRIKTFKPVEVKMHAA